MANASKSATQATKTRITFNLHAPGAAEVNLAGSFNAWDPSARPLKCDNRGTWRTWLNLPPGQHEYLFIVNGQWQVDPRCENRQENPYGSFNSVVQV